MTLEQLLELMEYGKRVMITIGETGATTAWMHNERSKMILNYKENKDRNVLSFTPSTNGIEIVLEGDKNEN
ncbi:hypothetical protein vipetofem_36 [Enterococcus phage vipetofem]|uniref:Uncharacterized protein n=1 Tax=Enterococcus phage vipetofem TaxID=2719594 RepID=A0A6G9LP26_9CAUD|nr:hypothetical protein KNU92_gp104 [Enterococcus phage vipetofem]QIQ66334.1 hypothetical protein vipetofem_36 [Enterococcus phage vipetofem]